MSRTNWKLKDFVQFLLMFTYFNLKWFANRLTHCLLHERKVFAGRDEKCSRPSSKTLLYYRSTLIDCLSMGQCWQTAVSQLDNANHMENVDCIFIMPCWPAWLALIWGRRVEKCSLTRWEVLFYWLTLTDWSILVNDNQRHKLKVNPRLRQPKYFIFM